MNKATAIATMRRHGKSLVKMANKEIDRGTCRRLVTAGYCCQCQADLVELGVITPDEGLTGCVASLKWAEDAIAS